MKTDNKNSEKDLNGNPESELNTNRTSESGDTFPESNLAKDGTLETTKDREDKKARKVKKDSDIELLADDVTGSVGDRSTGTSPGDIAGVQDLDRGMRRAKRR
jgi:hypothetical protein